jgi:hypothetical protein
VCTHPFALDPADFAAPAKTAFVALAGAAIGVATGAVTGDSTGVVTDAATAGIEATDFATSVGAGSDFASAVFTCEEPINAPRQFNTNTAIATTKKSKALKD